MIITLGGQIITLGGIVVQLGAFESDITEKYYYIANTPPSSGWEWGSDSNTGASKLEPINSIREFISRTSYGDLAILKKGTWGGNIYDKDIIIKRTLSSYIIVGFVTEESGGSGGSSKSLTVDTNDSVRVIITVEK